MDEIGKISNAGYLLRVPEMGTIGRQVFSDWSPMEATAARRLIHVFT